MRIIGELPHHTLKITVFKMNDKLSVKFEDRLIEHIIKFRPGSGVESIEDVQNLISEEFKDEILSIITQTAKSRSKLVLRTQTSNDEFPQII